MLLGKFLGSSSSCIFNFLILSFGSQPCEFYFEYSKDEIESWEKDNGLGDVMRCDATEGLAIIIEF